jgi:hypothetical protein
MRRSLLPAPSDTASPHVLSGGCYCGQIRYTSDAPPDSVCYCHCSICRRINGSVTSAWLTVPSKSFHFSGPTLTTFNSSDKYCRQFCCACGTQLFFKERLTDCNDTTITTIDICHGSLDDPTAWEPTSHVWCSSRLPFVDIGQGLSSEDHE